MTDMKGYTPMSPGSAVMYDDGNSPGNSPRDPDSGDGFRRQVTPDSESGDRLRRQQSMVAQKKAEFIALVEAAEANVEYSAIVLGAAEPEDIPNDCWGALVFVIVNDFPDLRAGRAVLEGKVRVAFCFFLFLINLFIQGVLLWFIGKLLMLPDILGAQNLYKSFHQIAFSDGVVDPDLFAGMSSGEKNHLCGMALSQGLFVRVILFLWVTTNVGELRDNFAKMVGCVSLPRLPDGLDTRLMVRDLPHTEQSEFCVICLNMKGKVGLALLVFIPKFVIAILLAFSGSLWLLSAESIGDLILNSLALAFVTKVDELLAAVFAPTRLQQDLANLCMMLPADPDDKDEDKLTVKIVWEFFQCTVVVVATFILVEVMFRYQPVLPNYGYDVAGPCQAYLQTQVPWCFPWQHECFPTA